MRRSRAWTAASVLLAIAALFLLFQALREADRDRGVRAAGPGPLAQVATHKDHPEEAVPITLVPSTEPVTVPDIVLRDGLEIGGRVIDAQGAPVSGALVIAQSQQGPAVVLNRRQAVTMFAQSRARGEFARIGAQAVSVRSGARGEFALKNLRDVELRLLVRAEGMVPQARVLRPGGDPVTFRLARGVEVEGRVTFRGKPLAGARVVARRGRLCFSQTKTGGDGRFRLTGLPRGEAVTFECRHNLYETLRIADFRAPAPARDYELSEGRVIAGVVVDEQGAPVPRLSLVIHAEVEPRPGALGQMKFISTDAEGRFRVGGLGFDEYVVQVTGGNWDLIAGTIGRVRTGDENARLTAIRGVEIRGIVRNGQGKGVDRVRVKAVQVGEGEFQAEARTRDGGSFWLHGLPEGSYELTVEKPWSLSPPVRVTPSPQPVTLVVRKE